MEDDSWQPPQNCLFREWYVEESENDAPNCADYWKMRENWNTTVWKKIKECFLSSAFFWWGMDEVWFCLLLLFTPAVEVLVAGIVCPCLAGIPSCTFASRDTHRHRHLGVLGAGQTCEDAISLHHCASLYCCVIVEGEEGVHEVHCIFVKVRGGGGRDELCC